MRLLDPNTMQPTTKLDFPGGKPVWGVDVQFSADGRYLAATVQTVSWPDRMPASAPGYAVVWDLRSPSTPPVRVPTGTDVQGLALSPDGQILYTGWPLTAYDVATGERIWRREDVTSWSALDVNAEGTLLALGDAETAKDAFLVDAATGETVHTLRGHRDSVCDIRFSPDGSLVGSVADDGELIVWDTATGRPLERWDTFDPWGVGFSPDNDLVYGGGGDSMLRTWDLSVEDTYLQQTTQVGDAEVFAQADISPDGQQVAYSWLDDRDTGWVRFVDTVTGEATPPARLPVSEGPLAQRHLASPGSDGTSAHCATRQCAEPGTVTVLDPATGKVLETRQASSTATATSGRSAYVDGGRSLLVGDVRRRHGPASSTPRPCDPGASPSTSSRHCCVTPIGDGSTAMVYELAGDVRARALAGDRRQHRRGPVRGGRGHGRLRIGRLSGRLDGRGGRGHRRDRHHRRLDRRRTAAIHQPRCRRCTGSTTPTTVSCWSPARKTAGSACGTPRRWTCWAPCTHPTVESRSRPARSSSATPTTWRSRRTTAGSTGGRPTSTGPSTSPARWPDGT